MSQASETGRPGRYNRSFGGLVGSMIVLVLAVTAFVIFRGTFRETPQYEAPDLDHLEFVASLQQLGLEPVYPAELPAGWTTKDASYDAGAREVDLVFATADGHTAGVHREDASEGELLETHVGDSVTENGETLTTGLGEWTGWDDTDGDHAWTTEIGDDTVLAYSSGDEDELRQLVETLTTEPLTP